MSRGGARKRVEQMQNNIRKSAREISDHMDAVRASGKPETAFNFELIESLLDDAEGAIGIIQALGEKEEFA